MTSLRTRFYEGFRPLTYSSNVRPLPRLRNPFARARNGDRMIVPLFAALVVAASPTPSSPLPSPSVTPSVTVPCAGRCLAGISVGDDEYRVLRDLDSRPLPGSDDRVMADFNMYPDGHILTVYYEKSVVAVSITNVEHGTSRIVDPYGVMLRDSAERLTALRGKPDSIDGTVWRYGAIDGLHWDSSAPFPSWNKPLL